MASPLTIQPSAADTPICSDEPTTNKGTQTYARIGNQYGSVAYAIRTLIKFSLSGIPAGSTITAVQLALWESLASHPATFDAHLYRVLRNWVENQATWNIYSTGNSWGTAGCDNTTSDRAAAASATIQLDGTAAGAFVTWGSTSELVADVQGWLDGTFSNYGWVVSMPGAENQTQSWDNQFWMKEYATDTSKRPKLIVEYTEASGGGGGVPLGLLHTRFFPPRGVIVHG